MYIYLLHQNPNILFFIPLKVFVLQPDCPAVYHNLCGKEADQFRIIEEHERVLALPVEVFLRGDVVSLQFSQQLVGDQVNLK